MVTVRIEIDEYLKEYLLGTYNQCKANEPLKLPPDSDLYHFLYDLMQKRPATSPADRGNLEIALPHRDHGKQPDVYNYISHRGRKILERCIKTAFNASLHNFIEDMHHSQGLCCTDAIHIFMSTHGIESIGENALWKNYYRWKKKLKIKRKYLIG